MMRRERCAWYMYWLPYFTCHIERDLSVAHLNTGEHMDNVNNDEHANNTNIGEHVSNVNIQHAPTDHTVLCD